MIRLLADENIHGAVVRELRRRLPEADLVTVSEAGLRATADDVVLEWAAHEERVVLTHDLSTLVPIAFERIGSGAPMPGVVAVPARTPIGRTIEFLYVVIAAGAEADFRDTVVRFP